MKPQIAYIKFVGEDGREIQVSAPEKAKWGKKLLKFLDEFAYLVVGIVIGIGGSGGSGGFRIKTIKIDVLEQNRMS